MGQRKKRHPRCPGCGVHVEKCLCKYMVEIDLPTRLVFVLHNRERSKPTNTGRLSHRMLRNSQLVYYGARDTPMDTRPFVPLSNYRVMYPRDDAEVFAPQRWRERLDALTLVILDGTWHQCSRMSRRAECVRELPFRKLDDCPPSRWGVRTPHRPGLVCTIESVIHVLTSLYGAEPVAPMNDFFARLCETINTMRGYSRGVEVGLTDTTTI